jgi:hypothetical protein
VVVGARTFIGPTIGVENQKLKRLRRRALPAPPQSPERFHASHLPKRSASQTLSDLRHRSSLRVGEPESGGQLGAKNAVFRREVLISQKEFLVDRSRDNASNLSHRLFLIAINLITIYVS